MPRSDVYFASHSPPKPYFQVYNQQNDLNYTYTGLTDNQSTARAETAPSNSSHTLREARSFHTERLTCSKKSRGVSRISKARKHSQPPNLRSNLLLTPIAFENCSSCLTPNIKFLISYYLPGIHGVITASRCGFADFDLSSGLGFEFGLGCGLGTGIMDITGTSKESIELRVASQNNGDTLLSFSDFSGGNYHSSRDDTTLRRLGKRPLLNRSFGFMSSLGLSCTVLLSWEGILVTSVPTFLSGGSGGVVWAFLIGWVGMASVYASVAELASIAPTAGGQYHWVAMMAPDSCANFLSYLTAWLTTLAWQVIAITTSYSVATIIQGIVVLARPTYVAISWHTVLIMWAAAVFSVLVNSTTGRALAKFEGAVLILHLTGFFGVLVPLVYFAPHNTPADVFTTFVNNGGWPSQGVAFLVGIPTVASTLTGADCAVHMSEEVRQANVAVPRALVYTIFINGALGFAMVIALLFCISDVPDAVAAADTMFYPFLQIFESAVKSTTGACMMAGVVLVLAVASSISTYASASRMMWSFARDKGLPFDRYLVKLNGNSLPVYAIICTMAITVLISLIVLGSSVVLSALLSLLLAAIYSSYLLACGLLLWRRCTGAFLPYTAGADEDPRNADQLFWGPWKLPEPFGTINNAFACVYTIFLLFWSFWPQSNNPDPEELNWSVVVYGAVVVFSIVWYVVRARHYFKGPIREV